MVKLVACGLKREDFG